MEDIFTIPRSVKFEEWLKECEQAQRERAAADIKREAAECDCWRLSGPICARCKLAQFTKQADAEARKA